MALKYSYSVSVISLRPPEEVSLLAIDPVLIDGLDGLALDEAAVVVRDPPVLKREFWVGWRISVDR